MGILAAVVALLFLVAPPGYTAPIEASSVGTIAPAELARGRWGLLFVVIPGCPACEEAVAWLGQAGVFPDLDLLLVGPWLTEELDAVSSQAGVPLVVDEGGAMGAGLGVRRAPTVVFLLDGFPVARLDWPFTEDELVRGAADLVAVPRGGPWQFLGTEVSLGMGCALDGEPVDLDALSRPLLLVFFNPLCLPCWDALSGLSQLRDRTSVVLMVVAPHALAGSERDKLRVTGLEVVVDGRELARRLAVRVSPAFLMVDREGVIRWVHEGVVGPEELGRAVLSIASEGRTDE